MDDETIKTTLLALIKEEGNKKCVDCQAPFPQWASVNNGVFFCLECSGVHRSLGVHLSFVRSITMDRWTETQLLRVQKGGNARANAYLSSQGLVVPTATSSVREKWSSIQAAHWRETLAADCEGRSFDQANVKVPVPALGPESAAMGAAPPAINATRTRTRVAGRVPPASPSRGPSPVTGNGGGYGKDDTLSAKETYFAGLGAANSGRPENLPPSQGGRYGGFGSSSSSFGPTESIKGPTVDDFQEDPLAALSKGWSWFSSNAIKTASTLQKDYIAPTTARLGDPEFQARMKKQVEEAARNAREGSEWALKQAKMGIEGVTKGNSGSSAVNHDANGDDPSRFGSLFDDVGSAQNQGKNWTESLTSLISGGEHQYGQTARSLDSQESGTVDDEEQGFFKQHEKAIEAKANLMTPKDDDEEWGKW